MPPAPIGPQILETLDAIAEYLRDLRELAPTQQRISEGLQNRADYGTPTVEDTVPWGGSADLSFNVESSNPVQVTAQQMMVHAARSRPTAWQVCFIVDLGAGWTGESEDAYVVELDLTIGVGKTQRTIRKQYTIGAPLDGSQAVFDTFAVASQAIQGTAQISVGRAGISGLHQVTSALFVAPFVQ